MNHSRFIPPILGVALMAAFFCVACAAPQNTTAASSDEIGSMLESKSFTFVPQMVSPTGGRTRQVTGGFFFRVSGDTVQSYLPYFGRSYSAPISAGQGGMDFTSTDFGYQVSQGRKGATVITIEPRSGTDVRLITMQVFPNGNASLQAQSNNRSAISYNGRISASKKKLLYRFKERMLFAAANPV